MIIGVVAALTIPNLYVQHQKSETLSKFKKTYASLSNAYALAVKDNGTPDNWPGLNGNPLPEGNTNYSEVFASYFEPHLKIAKNCGVLYRECWAQNLYAKDKKTLATINSAWLGYNYILADGTTVRFIGDDGVMAGYPFIAVDLNGQKGPNSVGHDVFLFGINLRRQDDILYGRLEGYDPKGLKYDREKLKNETTADGCNIVGRTGGYACSTLIIYDGFQIKDDYVW